MGGGDGAKERRRLKRLQKTENVPNKSPDTDRKNPKKKSFSKERNTFHAKRKDGAKKANPKAKSTKKKVKPKHLKRKLEQVSEADATARQELLTEMADWERKKSNYLQKNNKKRVKVAATSYEASTKAAASGHESVSNPQESEVDFPRSAVVLPSSPKKGAGVEVVDKQKQSTPDEGVKRGSEKESEDGSDANLNSEIDDEAPPKPTVDSGELSDDQEEMETDQRRQRGRRRRGRKDTSKQIEDSKEEFQEDHSDRKPAENEGNNEDPTTSMEAATPTDEKVRYCIGRKPVTDFVIGQKYSAKVVYVKPFGVFFDIGCHSDAFCHVSRLRDDFVDSPETLFAEGDCTEARVVEINRKEKRITVSLQSESRIQDELASFEARKKRKETRKSKSKKKATAAVNHESSSAAATNHQTKPKHSFKEDTSQKIIQQPPSPAVAASVSESVSQSASAPVDEANMTPAELKRARKLARRAARRAQAETA